VADAPARVRVGRARPPAQLLEVAVGSVTSSDECVDSEASREAHSARATSGAGSPPAQGQFDARAARCRAVLTSDRAAVCRSACIAATNMSIFHPPGRRARLRCLIISSSRARLCVAINTVSVRAIRDGAQWDACVGSGSGRT